MPKMKVIKSIYIDSAPEKIYPIISDLNNWQEWSPWVIAEPRAQLNVSSDGKFHEWDGDIIGAGNLKIQDEVENQSVTMALNFLKPWKSKAVTSFTLKKKKKGTEVVWTMDSSLPFFLFWMKKQMEIHWKGIQTIFLSTLFLEKERTSLERELQRRLGFLG